MTPLQIAKAHCANHQLDGSCLGADFDDQLRAWTRTPKPTCVLATPDVRCAYFEDCVIPMNTQGWPSHKAQDFADAIRDYRRAAQVGIRTRSRLCPQCKERENEPRRRFCDVYRVENHRRSTRRAVAKKRGLM